MAHDRIAIMPESEIASAKPYGKYAKIKSNESSRDGVLRKSTCLKI